GRNRGGANGQVEGPPGVVAGAAGNGNGNGPKGGGNGEGGGTGQPPAGGGGGSPPRKKPPTGGENDPGGNATLPPPSRQPGEGIVTKRPLQWGDPKSAAYGHSRSEHGSQRPPQQLRDRAAGGTPQGQYYDNNAIVEAEQRAPTEPGAYEIEMGRPIGRVYMPDGTIKENVTRVRVVRRANGTIKTSFPIE
ncbi:MAG TPA: hypothetical protein VJ302_13325, partial [Blastocatellia bacterium]|nr:hypothetical protein [Blastocatellia bacterium]